MIETVGEFLQKLAEAEAAKLAASDIKHPTVIGSMSRAPSMNAEWEKWVRIAWEKRRACGRRSRSRPQALKSIHADYSAAAR